MTLDDLLATGEIRLTRDATGVTARRVVRGNIVAWGFGDTVAEAVDALGHVVRRRQVIATQGESIH